MNTYPQRERAIQIIAEQLRNIPFTFDLKVVKHPKGIKVIREVTQEEMDAMMQEMKMRKGGKE